jgi:hypothetical protein
MILLIILITTLVIIAKIIKSSKMIKGMLVCRHAKLAVVDDALSLYTGRFSSSVIFLHPEWEQNTHKTLSSEKILHI